MKIGFRVEAEWFPKAMNNLGIPILSSKKSLIDEQFALARATEWEDLHEATDWWLYVTGRDWVRLQVTCNNNKNVKALADDIALIKMHSIEFEHASLGGHTALSKLKNVLTAALFEVFQIF